jgi:hypothetical protein
MSAFTAIVLALPYYLVQEKQFSVRPRIQPRRAEDNSYHYPYHFNGQRSLSPQLRRGQKFRTNSIIAIEIPTSSNFVQNDISVTAFHHGVLL